MTARRGKGKPPAHHTYSVFVSVDDTITMTYFGSSEAKARAALARAVVSYTGVHTVEIRKDFRRWLLVKIERHV